MSAMRRGVTTKKREIGKFNNVDLFNDPNLNEAKDEEKKVEKKVVKKVKMAEENEVIDIDPITEEKEEADEYSRQLEEKKMNKILRLLDMIQRYNIQLELKMKQFLTGELEEQQFHLLDQYQAFSEDVEKFLKQLCSNKNN